MPKGKGKGKRKAQPPSSEQQQAQAEGLVLLVADNKTGYFGVHLNNPCKSKPYQARGRRGGKQVHLGYFATAEEAALCVARSPEGQAAAGGAASVASQGTSPAVPPGANLQEESTIPAMAPRAVVTVEALLLLLDDDLVDECIGRDGRDNALLVKEEEDPEDVWPKRQRMK